VTDNKTLCSKRVDKSTTDLGQDQPTRDDISMQYTVKYARVVLCRHRHKFFYATKYRRFLQNTDNQAPSCSHQVGY